MILDRDDLTRNFTEAAIPAYTCPYCFKGTLALNGVINPVETERSLKEHDAEYWDVDFVENTFSCSMQCSLCKELVHVIGSGGVEEEYDVAEDGEWIRNYVAFYKPAYFYPSLQLIPLPGDTPKPVVDRLESAFALFFSHPDSCCNSIRAAAEEVLSDLNIAVTEEGTGRYISFANRINLLSEAHANAKALFDAIRWLGNYGSHPGASLTSSDACDALEIIELLLEDLYSTRKREIKDLVDRINNAKGPAGRRPAIVGR
ncbi:DUF4145 domain-containing protein [Pseudomonas sp. CrR14]|nr:DUF4145 domain-containing protein [Pseudomonas sp. CrR14]